MRCPALGKSRELGLVLQYNTGFPRLLPSYASLGYGTFGMKNSATWDRESTRGGFSWSSTKRARFSLDQVNVDKT